MTWSGRRSGTQALPGAAACLSGATAWARSWSTLAAIDGLSWARGVITTGCALDAMPKTRRCRRATRCGCGRSRSFACRISLGIDASALTQVEEVQRTHMSDPLVPRIRRACGCCMVLPSPADLRRRTPSMITLPWLAVHGEADSVCPPSGSTGSIDAIGSTDKQLVIYPRPASRSSQRRCARAPMLFELMSRWMLDELESSRAPWLNRKPRHTLARSRFPITNSLGSFRHASSARFHTSWRLLAMASLACLSAPSALAAAT